MTDRRERRNPRHPEVGRAPAPNFSNVTSKIGSRDRKHVPKQSNVKIFNDTAYIKAAKVRFFCDSRKECKTQVKGRRKERRM